VGKVTEEDFIEFMSIRRKKMNFKMCLLADCAALETPPDQKLITYIDYLSEICELRAAAFHDITSPQKFNSMYHFWHIWRRGTEDSAMDDLTMQGEFLAFIEDKCAGLVEQYGVKKNPAFN